MRQQRDNDLLDELIFELKKQELLLLQEQALLEQKSLLLQEQEHLLNLESEDDNG